MRRILDEIAERLAQGRRPDLEWYCLRHPDLEGDLHRRFRCLGLAEDPPPAPLPRGVLLEGLLRRRRTWARRLLHLLVPVLVLAAFLLSWARRDVPEDLSAAGAPGVGGPAGVEGLAALLILAAEAPRAREDLLREGLAEVDRALEAEGGGEELRRLRLLLLEGLERPPDPGAELAALSGVLSAAPGRPAAPPGAARELAREMVGAAASPGSRRALSKRLLRSAVPPVKLLGAVWGARAEDPEARAAIRALPLDGPAAARVLVEMGGEEAFLEGARPGRIDLAPLRLEVLWRRGERAQARRLAGDLLSAAPDCYELRLAAAWLLREDGDPGGAAAHLRAATLLQPASPRPMQEWMRLVVDFPERVDLLAPCAELLLRRSAQEVRAALERSGLESAAGIAATGLPSAGFGLPAEDGAATRATALAARAARLRPGHAALGFLAGRVFFERGLWGEAARVLASALETAGEPDRQAVEAWLSASLRRAGKEEETRAPAFAAAPGPTSGGAEVLEAEEDGRRAVVEEALVQALRSAGADDLELAQDRLAAAIREEPTDFRPWFLRGYFHRLRGLEPEADRDWDEVLGLWDAGSPAPEKGGGPLPDAPAGTALERAALPFALALIHASKGDPGAAWWFAVLGPERGRTAAGSFFRAAALAASGDLPGAEAEALAHRSRRFPLEPWMARDPWAGPLFEEAARPMSGE